MKPLPISRRFVKIATYIGVFVGSVGLLWATYRPFCAYQPRSLWLSAVEIELHLKERGLQLVRIRIGEDRCYAIVARDREGRFRDLVMHPVTADIVQINAP